MPAPLPTNLSWIQPPDTARNYLAGIQIGMEEQAAQARMAEIAQRQQLAQQQLMMEQQKLEMQHQENQQRHLEAQQELAINKTYRDMQLTAQKRQLDMAGQVMQARTQQAAQQAAATMEWEQFNKTLDANPALDDTTREAARRTKLMEIGPRMSPTHFNAYSQMMKAQVPLPKYLQGVPVMGPEGRPIAGMVGVPGASGNLIPRDIPGFQKEGSVGQANLLYARGYQKQLENINEQLDRFPYTDEDPPKDPIVLQRWNKLKKKRDELEKKIHQLVPEPGTASSKSSSGWQDIGGFKVRAIPSDIPSYPDQEEEQ